jgi:hypothetical protein
MRRHALVLAHGAQRTTAAQLAEQPPGDIGGIEGLAPSHDGNNTVAAISPLKRWAMRKHPRLSVSNAKKNWLNLNSSCLHAKIRGAAALGFKARQIVLIKRPWPIGTVNRFSDELSTGCELS